MSRGAEKDPFFTKITGSFRFFFFILWWLQVCWFGGRVFFLLFYLYLLYSFLRLQVIPTSILCVCRWPLFKTVSDYQVSGWILLVVCKVSVIF